MSMFDRIGKTKAATFLGRLRRDSRGNALAIIAAAIFPIIGMIGGGLDLSRMYLVKTRLQHACDAGALAGKRQMGGGAWTTTGPRSSNAIAEQFFNGNLPNGAYGATAVTKSFTHNAGIVTGTVSATVPMTLMAVFNQPSRQVTATCSAQEQVPNTDVMFVLDTTESMSENLDGDRASHVAKGGAVQPTSRITILKGAVKCFYESLTKIDTGEATCPTISGVATTARLRFGLVPYATNVNIRQLGLPNSYFARSWDYQSRIWSAASSSWIYKKVTMRLPTDLTSATTTISLPQGANGTDTSVTWSGCVEEKAPTSDITAIPSTSNANSLYGPLLPSLVYYRRYTAKPKEGESKLNTDDFTTTDNLFSASTYPYSDCPAAAWPLQSYPDMALGNTTTTFVNRVDSMVHGGNTRHDIGMLWGARLLSPVGIKAASNVAPANGGPLFRHLIFMTDGIAKANECDYATYGVPWFDNRTSDYREVAAGTAVTQTNCWNMGEPNTTLTNAVNSRLAALCTAVKTPVNGQPNTILWVISFAGGTTSVDAATKARLRQCATDAAHFFDADQPGELTDAFDEIAAQINQLRLTQ